MKQIISFFIFSLISFTVFAQSEKYQKAMEANVLKLHEQPDAAKLLDVANSFERIADTEKSQWLPYYYAAYAQVLHGFMLSPEGGAPEKTDPVADKAEALLTKAQFIKGENAEIYIIKKMIANLRMMADPMSRFQTYGPAGAEALAIAKKMDPENPRIALLEGQDKFFTPEQFGGSKSEAKKLFEESIRRFGLKRPSNVLEPDWGLEQAKYFYEMSSK